MGGVGGEDGEGGRRADAALPALSVELFEGLARLADAVRAFGMAMRALSSAAAVFVQAMVRECPVCGEAVVDLAEHASGKEDRGHVVLWIMES